MATLGFERGTAFMGEQLRFARELAAVLELARTRGRASDPIVRQRLADAYIGLELIRINGLRTVSQVLEGRAPGPEASVGKLHWSTWRQRLGALGMDLLGPEAVITADGELNESQHIFVSSRAQTIYAGSSEIQRNIIGERVLGLPREPS
jgi:alkylation response protein AidB-like acyl-CoA dehydrogenase